jgi:hypothetical protein
MLSFMLLFPRLLFGLARVPELNVKETEYSYLTILMTYQKYNVLQAYGKLNNKRTHHLMDC